MTAIENSNHPERNPDPRLRSQGVLGAEELAWCHAHGIELGFDPIQHGYVPLSCIDNIGGRLGNTTPAHRRPAHSTGPLTFRRWHNSDAPVFLDLLGREPVWTFMPETRPDLDLSTAIDLITLSNESDHHDVYAVILGGRAVGQARLLFDLTSPGRSAAEISYWIGEPYWRRGIGSRLVQEFTLESFKRWPSVTTIVARVHVDNTASLRALSKAAYSPAPEQAADDWVWYRITRSV